LRIRESGTDTDQILASLIDLKWLNSMRKH